MNIGEICSREVVVAEKTLTLPEVAHLMREYHVGSVVVIEDTPAGRVPVGIVTDRDIVIAVVGKDIAAQNIAVGEIIGARLLSIGEGDSILDAISLMRHEGVRRLPVLVSTGPAKGTLAGIVTLDDTLEIVAEQLNDLAAVVSRGRSREEKIRR